MAYGEITVGELRKAMADLPDNAVVLVKPFDPTEFAGVQNDKDHKRAANLLMYCFVPWNYNTRQVHNAYSCNDDRFNPSSVLCIELGDTSP